MKNKPPVIYSVVFSAVVICFAVSACSKPEKQNQKANTQSTWKALVPGSSDILLAADMDQLRNSEWYSADSSDPRSEELSAKAGFSFSDISTFILASDLDSMPSVESLKNKLSVTRSGQPDTSILTANDVEGLNATVLLCINRKISWKQAHAAVNVFFSSVTNATVLEAEDEQVITVKQDSSPMLLRVRLSKSRDILIMETGATGKSETPHSTAPAVKRLELYPQTDAPVRIAMTASRKMQAAIKKASTSQAGQEQQDATSAVMVNIMRSFSSFRGFMAELTPAEQAVELYAEMELGAEEHALKAEAALKNILIPLVTLAMAQYSSENQTQQPILQKTHTEVQGNKIIIKAGLNTRPVNPKPSSAER